MKTIHHTLFEEYSETLGRYLAGAGEIALEHAYELGRTAVSNGVGVMDFFRMYQQALERSIQALGDKGEGRRVLGLASLFFIESLSPFEMIHRGFQESIKDLRELNRTLEEQVASRTESLRKSEEQYRLITEKTRDLVCMIDLDAKFLYASPSFEETLGYTPEELFGTEYFSLIHPADTALALRGLQRALFRDEGKKNEFRFRSKAGHYITVESLWNWIFDEKGNPGQAVVASRDITDWKLADTSLKASEIRYRKLFETAREGIVLIAADTGEVTDVNPFFSRMVNAVREDILGRKLWEMDAFSQLPQIRSIFDQLEGRESLTYESVILRRKHGGEVEVELLCNSFMLGDRKVIQCSIHDLTARKRTERRLIVQHAVASAIAESTSLTEGATRILQAICQTLQCDLANLWNIERETGELQFVGSWSSLAGTEQKHPVAGAHTGLSKKVMRTGDALWIPNLKRAARLTARPELLKWGFHSALAFPIRLGGEIIGIVEGFGKGERRVEDDVVDIVGGVGNQIGQFIERVRTESALRESEERYRTVAETASDAIVTIDEDSTIVFANLAAGKIFGYDITDMVGMNVTELMPEELRERHRSGLRRFVESGEKRLSWRGIEFSGLHKDGHEIPIEMSFGSTMKRGHHMFTGIIRDVTERRQTEARLRASEEHLRQFSAKLQAVREEERTWIAREIHDEFGQSLTGMKMYLSSIQAKIAAGIPQGEHSPLLEKIASMSKLLDMTISSVQRVATELRPGVLDDLGIVAALEWQAEEFGRRTGVACEFVSNVDDVELDKDRSTAFFRIFQEALTNVARHSGATRVDAVFERHPDKLVLQIHDNGKGIVEGEAANTKSLGILGMKERTLLFGGDFTITGKKGKGTTVTIVAPLSSAAVP